MMLAGGIAADIPHEWLVPWNMEYANRKESINQKKYH